MTSVAAFTAPDWTLPVALLGPGGLSLFSMCLTEAGLSGGGRGPNIGLGLLLCWVTLGW